MKAYKFLSCARIEHALDILHNRRLHCADWRRLNDPMEGLYTYSSSLERAVVERIVKGIGNAKQGYKVCSLSSTIQSHLLWSHYAGGFDGLAIEVALPEDDFNIRVVEYRDLYFFLDLDNVRDEHEAAQMILFSKYEEWEYEREI